MHAYSATLCRDCDCEGYRAGMNDAFSGLRHWRLPRRGREVVLPLHDVVGGLAGQMPVNTSERDFEATIEASLLRDPLSSAPQGMPALADAPSGQLTFRAATASANPDGLRPGALPDPGGRAGLHLRHPAQGVGEDEEAARRGRQKPCSCSGWRRRSTSAARWTCCARASRPTAASSSWPTSARPAG